MFTFQNGIVRTSVRNLVEFLLREGDIHNQGNIVADVELMQAGSRIHRKIQKNQKITYRAEVPLKMEWNMVDFQLTLEGRADGIDKTDYGSFTSEDQLTLEDYLNREEIEEGVEEETFYYIDEIKGVLLDLQEIETSKPLHLAQAKCYAAIYARQKDLHSIGIQITYCNIETEEIKKFHYLYKRQELDEWFDELIDAYKMWASFYVEARKNRQDSIKKLVFPFDYREGQKKLIAMVYHSIGQKKKVFFQAPTGIGKTISTIYPSLKSIAEEKGDRIYYLTAKTITRTVAEDTLRLLKKQGLSLKATTLTAKEKICTNEVFECNPNMCEKAKGHFDRINEALFQLLSNENTLTRETILIYSEKYQVCPYQLSFEAATFSDFIICDYNYVFDPHVNSSNVGSGSETRKNILLIDEAHNLVERAREMYSAVITEEEFVRLKSILPKEEKRLQKRIQNCKIAMKKIRISFADTQKIKEESDYYVEAGDVDALYFPLFRLNEALTEYLTEFQIFEGRDEVVEIFFRMRHFLGIMETMTDGYRIFCVWHGRGFMIRLFCIDPSSQLKEILEKNTAAVFFSATLLPMPYYRNLLYGEEAEAFAIDSPFDPRKRLICISNDVTSRYTRRNSEEYKKILSYIKANVNARKGNYMVFFPSYEMMEQTCQLIEEVGIDSSVEFLLQSPAMEEREKEEFLETFSEEREKSLVGLCVLGSIFSEGIDLTGKRLVGVIIVGTGLPKVCLERNMIRSYFDIHDKKGYDYAYRYPGMNKVLQAAGRVIRTAEDVGVITLLDERFLWRENQYLLPEDWDRYYEVNLQNFSSVLEEFWKDK